MRRKNNLIEQEEDRIDLNQFVLSDSHPNYLDT